MLTRTYKPCTFDAIGKRVMIGSDIIGIDGSSSFSHSIGKSSRLVHRSGPSPGSFDKLRPNSL